MPTCRGIFVLKMRLELWTDLRAISVFELMQNEMDAGAVGIAVGYRGQNLQAAITTEPLFMCKFKVYYLFSNIS